MSATVDANAISKEVEGTKTNGSKPAEVIVLDDEPEEIIDLVGQIAVGDRQCLNYLCQSGVDLFTPPMFCMSFYQVKNDSNKNQKICRECYNIAVKHYDMLYEAVENNKTLLDVDMPLRNDTFAIDDSDSEEEVEKEAKTYICDETMVMLNEHLDEVLSNTMVKFNLDDKVDGSINYLQEKHETNCENYEEIKKLIDSVRVDMDSMLFGLFKALRVENKSLPALDIPLYSSNVGTTLIGHKRPIAKAVRKSIPATSPQVPKPMPMTNNIDLKGRLSANVVANQGATPKTPMKMGGKKIEITQNIEIKKATIVPTNDDNTPLTPTLSVDLTVKEIPGIKPKIEQTEVPFPMPIMSAPTDLPPRGEYTKPPMKVGDIYYGTRPGAIGSWTRVKLDQIVPPNANVSASQSGQQLYYVSIENNQKHNTNRYVNAKCLAYSKAPDVILEVGNRVIALFREDGGELRKNKRNCYYPGIIGESPHANNKYRYLIFFDDGYSHYVHYSQVFVICESSPDVWDDVIPESRAFIKKYLTDYPDRSMVKLCKSQTVRTEFKGHWYVTTVLNVDCSLVQMFFDGLSRSEWIYRGSRRLNTLYKEEQAASNRLQNRSRVHRAANVTTASGPAPYVQYTRDDPDIIIINNDDDEEKTDVAPRTVAKKSTKAMPVVPEVIPRQVVPPKVEGPPGKIVYYTPRKQDPAGKVFIAHRCSANCQKHMYTTLARLKGYGPLAKPLLCGFCRLHLHVRNKKLLVWIRTPCGRSVRDMLELHRYLRETTSALTVDLFNFEFWVRCLAEFILEPNTPIIRDLSSGAEEIPIPVVNYIDNELNDFTNYSTKRLPMDGVNLNLDPEFLVGCDCEDDCSDKDKCSCWQLTLQGIKYLNKDKSEIGYDNRRLHETVFTGIYECNSRCKCSKTCLNRVVQNPLQHKLQLFKTASRGWGIRCINDIPQGSFICIYAGALLTEQMANEGGKNYGDEYLAELDYIESVEKSKEDYEEEAYNSQSESEKNEDSAAEEDEDEEEEMEVDRVPPTKKKSKDLMVDYDFVPTSRVGDDTTGIRTRLRKRTVIEALGEDKQKDMLVKKTAPPPPPPVKTKPPVTAEDDDTVMISDDDEVIREPSSFNPADTDDLNETFRKYQSVRDMFGKDECVYIMDAKNTGNIGRYLNHSCSPNVFVQNVFVDTHDVRFPWVSFFASVYIRAGTELTWNYNYDIGSVQGKVLYCHCGSLECKGRLL